MKFKKILIVLGVVIIVGILTYILYVGKNALTSTDYDYSQINPFPKSPQEASYQIEGVEMQFIDGISKAEVAGENVLVSILNEPVYGDINDDEEDDAVFLVTYTKNDAQSLYYIALAIQDNGGFLGLNAVPLHNQYMPKEVLIRDEVVMVSYDVPAQNDMKSEDGLKQDTLYEYLTVTGVTLEHVNLQEEDVVIDRGVFVFTNEQQTFTSCNSGEHYQISPESHARAAMEAIYRERTRYVETNDDMGVYVVVAGNTTGLTNESEDTDELEAGVEATSTEMSEIENEDKSTKELSVAGNTFNVQTVLSAPKKGSCSVEKEY